MMSSFQPPGLLRSAHVQTILGSRGRSRWVLKRADGLRRAARREILQVADGVRLEAWLSLQPQPAPGVILIHGWLGHADSSYVLSAAAELWQAGFSIARLNLRDHGNTAHLNPGLFNSARFDEVVEAVDLLARHHLKGPCGLAGFSLGGNFALRVAKTIGIETAAICPAVDPPATMERIDSGFIAYRLFFLRKWRRALSEKEHAFPDRYRFHEARKLATVCELTDLFVAEHTEFPSTDAYFDAYSLTGQVLDGTRATIIYAEDDPVIPAEGFATLPDSIELVPTTHGGHCAHIERLSAPSWTDRYLAAHFRTRLAG